MSGQRTVLVTGATRGIGAAIADAFREEGARLLLTGTSAEQVAELNAQAPANTEYIAADFSDPTSTSRLLERVASLPRLDVCVNNAGINIIKPIDEVSETDLDRLQAINYRTPFLLSREAVAVMKRRGGGRIINVASIWSVIGKANRSLYAASKSALVGMTRALAVELGRHGILVNCVSPGFVSTDLTSASLTKAELAALANEVPLGRMATPAEVARVDVFLASEQNTYLTGQNVVVDGGFSIV